MVVFSQSRRLTLRGGTAKSTPERGKRKGRDRPPAREPSAKGWRRNPEAIRDSACAALAVVDNDRVYEEEKEEGKEEFAPLIVHLSQHSPLSRIYPGCARDSFCESERRPERSLEEKPGRRR